MKIILLLEDRLKDIRNEVLLLIENQKLSLTEKNIKMEPLTEEKKVLEYTLKQLNKIKNTNYKGFC